MKIKAQDLLLAGMIVLIVMIIILPLPTWAMDMFLVLNISLSLLILLMALYIKEPLEFSSFPSMLLVITLFRLSLNLSSTKLVLGNQGDAGNVIRTFGSFVIGDNLVVGVVVFLLIVIMQFIVITKGTERVSEVAARFTLDAMPGKQMAIDADLNSGIIDEQTARERRIKIQREADFYGSMDGSSKFVKGDAILGILTTMVNIAGGLIIGFTSGTGMAASDIVSTYVLTTVGDGLVSQIPALLVSTATGLIVTRAASENSLGQDLVRQLTGQPPPFFVLSGVLVLMCLIPGLPTIPMLAFAIGFFTLGSSIMRASQKKVAPVIVPDQAEASAQEMRKPESVTSLLQVELIGIELGYGLIPLADASQGGDLLERVVMIRRQCALDLGIIVPIIRLRDNIQLSAGEYSIKIKGVEVARSEVMLDHFLSLSTGETMGTVQGIPTIDPTFGLPALWITQADRERAELMGYTTIDPPSVIATHITEVIKRHSAELLSRQQVQTLVDNLKAQQPALVEDTIPKMFSLGEVQKILASLLGENVPIRDMGTIVETISDYGAFTRDVDLLTEYVRQGLARAISKRFVPDNKVHVITVNPDVEQTILERVKKNEHGTYVALDQQQIQGLFTSLKSAVEKMNRLGITPMVLTSGVVRRHFKRVTEQFMPDLIVLSYNELNADVEIFADGAVNF